MRIITFAQIKEFSVKNPEAAIALRDWYAKTNNAVWNNFVDVKQTFNSADYVGNNRFVFNVKGNDYRLVAIIILTSKKVYIRFIGSHSEYDKIDCSII